MKSKSRLMALVMVLAATARAGDAGVVLSRVPEGGLQPQALVGTDGSTHLIYFKGDAKAGDVYYSRRPPGASEFSKPMRVNSLALSATAIGTIRGPQIALGENDRVHVAWNGTGKAAGHAGMPMFYTRMNDAGTGFEPQRDVMTFTGGLDGGGSVAADRRGNVYVAWHGNTPATQGKEDERAVFLAVSSNGGRTFEPERKVNPEDTGACGCCGLKVRADPRGDLYLVYRMARGGSDRDETLLVSHDHGKSFRTLHSDSWNATFCPMSSACLADAGGKRTIAAWETMGKVWFTLIDPSGDRVGEPVSPGGGAQKHPAAAVNKSGQIVLVWAEGTGWQKGGAVAWRVYDSQGHPTSVSGRKEGLPAWSLPAAVARNDGGFEIIY